MEIFANIVNGEKPLTTFATPSILFNRVLNASLVYDNFGKIPKTYFSK